METIRELSSKDLAKLSCSACNGCGECCVGMGDTIHLDPWDLAALTKGLGAEFTDLLEEVIGLHVERGLILPHLLMCEETTPGRCAFLNEENRCGIHGFRPGLCRLFPLGRNYTEQGFSYFVVEGGCDKPGKSKIRIEKWLGIPDLSSYERFTFIWHSLVRALQARLEQEPDASYVRDLNRFFLGLFYEKAYPVEDTLPGKAFYEEFYKRLEQFKSL